MTATTIIHELPQRGQVFELAGAEVEITYVDFDSATEDGIIGLRQLDKDRIEPMSLSAFVDENPELVVG